MSKASSISLWEELLLSFSLASFPSSETMSELFSIFFSGERTVLSFSSSSFPSFLSISSSLRSTSVSSGMDMSMASSISLWEELLLSFSLASFPSSETMSEVLSMFFSGGRTVLSFSSSLFPSLSFFIFSISNFA